MQNPMAMFNRLAVYEMSPLDVIITKTARGEEILKTARIDWSLEIMANTT